MFGKRTGWGRAVVATMLACVAVGILAGCSLDENIRELERRGFEDVHKMTNQSTFDYIYYVGVDDCRGTVTIAWNDGRMTFSASNESGTGTVMIDDPTATVVRANDEMAYCAEEPTPR